MCPWLMPTDESGKWKCLDGTFTTNGCVNNGGRAQCPQNSPKMCATRECAGQTDFCCEGSCDNDHHGGERPCEGYGIV